MREAQRHVSWRGTFPVAAADLWHLFSDTDRVNEALGVPPTSFRPTTTPNGPSALEARTVYFGIRLHWLELPFEWSAGQWFSVERVFLRAPLVRSVRIGARFRQRSINETEVEVFAELVPRSTLGGIVARALLERVYLPRLVKIYQTLVANSRRQSETPAPGAHAGQRGRHAQRVPGKGNRHPLPRRGLVNEQQLGSAAQRLRGAPVQPELIDQLIAVVRSADERDLVRIRPFELADRWQVDRIELLRLCLYATRAGLFDVTWEVLCPNCRVSKASFATLSDLQPEAHCETCDINFDVNFDEYVELRFTVHPSIRETALGVFCVGGPSNTRHITGQLRVPSGMQKELAILLDPGIYRLRVRGQRGRTIIRVSENGDDPADLRSGAMSIGHSAEERLIPEELVLSAGECRLRMTNEGAHEVVAIIEQDAWGMQGASAALVTSLQEFRLLFGSELLAPDMGIAVRNITILFSDLKDSTQMYSDVGDPLAYALVRDHFAMLTRILQQHRGALVKTIGDSVMAVFMSARDGLDAALAIQSGIVTLNTQEPAHPHLCIKLGLHRGSCIAITANNVLDYFGSTVNLAARVHGQSHGDDIVLTEAIMDDPEVRLRVHQAGLDPQRFEAALAGFSGLIALYRLKLVQATNEDHE